MKLPLRFRRTTSLLLFFGLMWVGFHFIFLLSAYPTGWIDAGVISLQSFLHHSFSPSIWTSLFVDGILGGMGATLLFLPQIVLLFLFLETIRASGYFQRSGHILDSSMKVFGLQGQSTSSLMMGFGCNVPAIITVRNLENRKEKIITTMMIPFMSCAARLPVYTLIVSAFFPQAWQGTVLFGVYFFGMMVGVGTGIILHRFLPEEKKRRAMEEKLRFPNFRVVAKRVLNMTGHFVTKIGKVILPLSFVVWALFAFPQPENAEDPIGGSYAAHIGRAIEPVFRPLGFDWKITTALLSGVAAKEAVLSTLGTLYSMDSEPGSDALLNRIRFESGLTLPAALALLVFVLLYVPCVGAIAAMRQEVGNGWALVGMLYPTVLAWLMALLTYRVAMVFWGG